LGVTGSDIVVGKCGATSAEWSVGNETKDRSKHALLAGSLCLKVLEVSSSGSGGGSVHAKSTEPSYARPAHGNGMSSVPDQDGDCVTWTKLHAGICKEDGNSFSYDPQSSTIKSNLCALKCVGTVGGVPSLVMCTEHSAVGWTNRSVALATSSATHAIRA
jgi:hypothetical protein